MITRDSFNKTGYSVELLPPLRGFSAQSFYSQVQKFLSTDSEYRPSFIDITAHQSVELYKEKSDGLYNKTFVCKRPGSIALAAMTQAKFGIPVIPHIICAGNDAQSIEQQLIDMQYLELRNCFVLRGDFLGAQKPSTLEHASHIMQIIEDFNDGRFVTGETMSEKPHQFVYGCACYPEKHYEAPNLGDDIMHLLDKQEIGASYAITQLFFDNVKFYKFVDFARAMGVSIPIVPGLKLLTKGKQLQSIPKTFFCDLPKELVDLLRKDCSDEDKYLYLQEWTFNQVEDLRRHGFMFTHFYATNAVEGTASLIKDLFK